jgi:Xaa-Pro aminopeptidase
MTTEYAQRRARLVEEFPRRRIDALAVNSLTNIRYLTGFTGSAALLLLEPDRATLFTDPRYDLQVRREVDCRVHVSARPALQLQSAVRRRRIRRLGFEAAHCRYSDYQRYAAALKPATRLLPTQDLVESLRVVKSPAEIAAIRHSVEVNSAAFSAAIARLQPGISEQDLAAELDYQMRLHGAAGPAFETIVAAGENSALPHARPGARRLRSNELLLIDMGALVGGYASDMTRMLHLGAPKRKTRQLYRSVLDAQLAAIAALRDGVPAHAVDHAARRLLAGAGLDKLFIHSTGHGLGLDIHESPRIARREPSLLRAGMVVTIEPGVYVPGEGGIRIEDTVVITASGCEVLTPTTKELLVI